MVVGAMEEHLNCVEKDQSPSEVLRLNRILGVALNASHSDCCVEVVGVHEENFESWFSWLSGVKEQLHKVGNTIVLTLLIPHTDEVGDVRVTLFVDISPVCMGYNVLD